MGIVPFTDEMREVVDQAKTAVDDLIFTSAKSPQQAAAMMLRVVDHGLERIYQINTMEERELDRAREDDGPF